MFLKCIYIYIQPIRGEHGTYLLLLYPCKQPVEGEAGPVCCVIAPPEIYTDDVSAVAPGGYLVTSQLCHACYSRGPTCQHGELSVPLWRELQPPLTRSDLTHTDSHTHTSFIATKSLVICIVKNIHNQDANWQRHTSFTSWLSDSHGGGLLTLASG